MVGHRLGAGHVHDEHARCRVIALGVDEPLRKPLDVVRRRQLGRGALPVPLGDLCRQVLVDAIPQACTGSAIHRHEAEAKGDRGDERDRERELGAQSSRQQTSSHAGACRR